VEDKTKQENDLMLTIFELVKNGANPTIKSTSGQQPKQLAFTVGFALGVLLIGKTSSNLKMILLYLFVDLCEKAWLSKHRDNGENPNEISGTLKIKMVFVFAFIFSYRYPTADKS